MENQKKGKSSVKMIFASYFMILMTLYAFFDDGGLATKSGYDFLFRDKEEINVRFEIEIFELDDL